MPLFICFVFFIGTGAMASETQQVSVLPHHWLGTGETSCHGGERKGAQQVLCPASLLPGAGCPASAGGKACATGEFIFYYASFPLP